MKEIKKYKTALLLTGSGGTISQEVAIIEQLINKGNLKLDPKDTLLIATGSGAINLIAINACFRNENPLSWDNFYKNQFLSSFSDNDIFLKVDPIHWLTLPQRKKFNELLREANFSKVSDLPFDSIIISTSCDENKPVWIKSFSKKARDISISDVLMASSAIPVIFPTQQLNSLSEGTSNKFTGAHFEGALGGLLLKFRKQVKKIVMEHGAFEKIIIVSPKRLYDNYPAINHDFSSMITQEKYQFTQFLNQISLHGFLSFLIKLQKANQKKKLAKSIEVSIPEAEGNFGLLDFSDQLAKYSCIYKWFNEHPDRVSIDISNYIREIAFIPSFSESYYNELESGKL